MKIFFSIATIIVATSATTKIFAVCLSTKEIPTSSQVIKHTSKPLIASYATNEKPGSNADIHSPSSPFLNNSWTELIQDESRCVLFQFLTVECYLGSTISPCGIVTRLAKTCPHYKEGIIFDIVSRVAFDLDISLTGIDSYLTHPRYRVSMCLNNRNRLAKAQADIRNCIYTFLGLLESRIFLNILSTKEKYYPLRYFQNVPFLFGDSSTFADTKSLKHEIFYFLVRRAINSYKPKISGFTFFTTPHQTRHDKKEKYLYDFLRSHPRMFLSQKTQFLPVEEHYFFHRELAPHVVIGRDTTAFIFQVEDPSRYPALPLEKIPSYESDSPSMSFISVPFLNLGASRASAILSKIYCERNVDRIGICHHPCFPIGWVQTCHGGSYEIDSLGRFRAKVLESIRPSWYCDAKRKEMQIDRQRRLCETTLGYNISDSYSPSRSKIRNCHLIVGTGNACQCREAIHKHLMQVEIPFSDEAVQSGFGTPTAVKRFGNGKIKSIVVRGVFNNNIKKAIKNILNETEFETYTFKKLPWTLKRDTIDYTLEISKFDLVLKSLCEHKWWDTNMETRERHYGCFLVSFLLEVLDAFGATDETRVVVRAAGMLAGFLHLGMEWRSDFTRNLIDLGSHHWKSLKIE